MDCLSVRSQSLHKCAWSILLNLQKESEADCKSNQISFYLYVDAAYW